MKNPPNFEVAYKKVLRDVRTLFQESKKSSSKDSCVRNMIETLGRVMRDEALSLAPKLRYAAFCKAFFHCLSYAMAVFDRNPAVDSVLDFVSEFLVSLPRPSEGTEGDAVRLPPGASSEDDSLHPLFVLTVRDYIFEIIGGSDKAVRLRSCQLLTKMLKVVPEGTELSDELFSTIQQMLLDRARDRVARVRLHAVNALARMQTPGDRNDHVIRVYMFLLKSDPCPEVRNAVLGQMALTKVTLPALLERARDVNDYVRRSAYLALSERVSIKVLTIANRVRLLQEGLKDRAELVRSVVCKKLIPAWLGQCEGSVERFLGRLDVLGNKEVAEMAIRAHFRDAQPESLIQELDILDEHLVPCEISPEKVFLWRALVQYFRNSSADSEKADELIDSILPPLMELVEFVNRYIVTNPSLPNDIEESMNREFISQQLLDLLPFADLSDEAGRKRLLEVLKALIANPELNNVLLAQMVKILLLLEPNLNASIHCLAEMIAEIRIPSEPTGEDLTEEHVISDRPEVLIKCLTIAVEIMKNRRVKSLNDTLRALFDDLIVPSIVAVDPCVRNVAFRALGLSLLLERSLISKHIVMFVQTLSIDVVQVRLTALQVIFDLLLVYGMNIIETALPSDENPARNISDSLLAVLVDILDKDEEGELHFVVAEGLAKLLLHRRIYSPKLLSRMILMWFNPVSEGNKELCHCLGTFLPIFAFADHTNQEALEEAFFPTLRTLMDAPLSHPFATVDVCNVASFLIELTNHDHLKDTAPGAKERTVHGLIAIKTCDEILHDPTDAYRNRIFGKILSLLNFRGVEYTLLRDFQSLLNECIKIVGEQQQKTFSKVLQKVSDHLNTEIQKTTEDNADPMASETEIGGCEVPDITTDGDGTLTAGEAGSGPPSETPLAGPSGLGARRPFPAVRLDETLANTTTMGGIIPKRQLLKANETTMLITPPIAVGNLTEVLGVANDVRRNEDVPNGSSKENESPDEVIRNRGMMTVPENSVDGRHGSGEDSFDGSRVLDHEEESDREISPPSKSVRLSASGRKGRNVTKQKTPTKSKGNPVGEKSNDTHIRSEISEDDKEGAEEGNESEDSVHSDDKNVRRVGESGDYSASKVVVGDASDKPRRSRPRRSEASLLMSSAPHVSTTVAQEVDMELTMLKSPGKRTEPGPTRSSRRIRAESSRLKSNESVGNDQDALLTPVSNSKKSTTTSEGGFANANLNNDLINSGRSTKRNPASSTNSNDRVGFVASKSNSNASQRRGRRIAVTSASTVNKLPRVETANSGEAEEVTMITPRASRRQRTAAIIRGTIPNANLQPPPKNGKAGAGKNTPSAKNSIKSGARGSVVASEGSTRATRRNNRISTTSVVSANKEGSSAEGEGHEDGGSPSPPSKKTRASASITPTITATRPRIVASKVAVRKSLRSTAGSSMKGTPEVPVIIGRSEESEPVFSSAAESTSEDDYSPAVTVKNTTAGSSRIPRRQKPPSVFVGRSTRNKKTPGTGGETVEKETSNSTRPSTGRAAASKASQRIKVAVKKLA